MRSYCSPARSGYSCWVQQSLAWHMLASCLDVKCGLSVAAEVCHHMSP